ncbi:hypothetical protein ACN38_g11172 [Penicillium nordicum]|uniref:Uncharacterized protein n=1 Tax=Penicillium nordicum TaxID=229535 RepID=A0A0M8NZ83_9EURO|nr:hypothetical protein ACN38_g11172 [Penicillium nordicum]
MWTRSGVEKEKEEKEKRRKWEEGWGGYLYLPSGLMQIGKLRSPRSANPVLPSDQSSGSDNAITDRHCDGLRQSNDHVTLISQLRAHGLILDDRGTSSPQSPDVPYTEYAFVESQQLMSLPSEDVALLTSKSCLSWQTSNAIDEFVQEYFKHIHPWRVLEHLSKRSICRPQNISFCVAIVAFSKLPSQCHVVTPVTPVLGLNSHSLFLYKHCVDVDGTI